MKTPELLKEADFDPQFATPLRELLRRVPFLKLASLRKDVNLSPKSPDRANLVDAVADTFAGDRKWTLVAE